MLSKSDVPLDRAARMLDTDMKFLITEIVELGIEVKKDSDTGVNYISADGLEELMEIKSILD